jgi:hypothetical protein
LVERLLGKSPLRLVLDRRLVEKNLWEEKLECGHTVTAFQDFLWDANGFLIEFEPTAKRRRCRRCKPAVAPVLKTSAEIRADQARAELIHRQQLRFGSLFDQFCFPNGELRPGATEEELAAWCEQHRREQLFRRSPKKPAQSAPLVDEHKWRRQ